MYYDYFLMHRALQIQRLRAAEAGNRIDLPSRIARTGYSKAAGQLCRTVDTICSWDFGDKPKQDRWGWLKIRSFRWWPGRPAEPAASGTDDATLQPMVTAEQRAVINEFESGLVRARLGDDSSASELATAIMEALWQDRDFFNGLKPLAAHTEHFAYEFLYPTWLNLYAVLTGVEKPEAKLSPPQVKTIFRFLDEYERGGTSQDPELVALITFLANRWSGDELLALLQRLIDLCGCRDCQLAIAAAAVVRPLRDLTRTTAEFRQLIHHYLIVESCLYKDRQPAAHRVSPNPCLDQALPAALEASLRELELDLARGPTYVALVKGVGRVVVQAGGFAQEFVELLTRNPAHVPELVELIAPPDDDAPPLAPDGQRVVAQFLASGQERSGELELQRVRAFARHVVPRMTNLDAGVEHALKTQFIQDEANRRVLLDHVADAAKRGQIAGRLALIAKKTTDPERFFNLVELVAILDPAYDDDALHKVRQSTQVLRLAIANASIVGKQLNELVEDLQHNLPGALHYLESPDVAAAGKPGRVGKLYQTLYHEREAFAKTGRVGNFSLSHAAYHRAKRTGGEES
jgi:hypothetical protein